MPLYEYRCQKCAHLYEKREGFDAPARQKCPTCGGQAQRVLHAAPIVFKGSGFYITDNRASESEAKTESEAKSESEAKTGSEVKTKSAKTEATNTSDGSANADAEPAAAS